MLDENPPTTHDAPTTDICPVCHHLSISDVRRDNSTLGVSSNWHLCGNGHLWETRWMAESWPAK